MKNLGYIIFMLVLGVLGMISCGEEEIQEDGIEPFFQITFIDNDSLAILNASVSSFTSQISVIDSTIAVIDAAENKSERLEEKDRLNDEKDSLRTERTSFNRLITDVNNGLTDLNSVNAIPQEIPTRNRHTLPLNSNDTISRFFFILKETVQDTLFLSYDLNLEFRENQLRATATNLDTIFHSFDSIQFSCTSCTSNEQILTVYF